jgi:serine/threonine protein kinase
MLNFTEVENINLKYNNKNLQKDDFTFISQLGVGSFGKVYKVVKKSEKEEFALKVLSKKQLESLKLVDQFKNEIKILSNCDHKNIIKLYGLFEDEMYIYMLMELARGGTLFSKMKKEKRLSEEMVRKYMTDIIEAVEYLHSKTPPILHRDIKPENILLCENVLKIADFGWSSLDDKTRNTFCGTPDYLSPEMILGTGHNEKLDVWTLGVLMYELIYNKAPFTPDFKINDMRMRQKKIEENILKGNISFDDKISPQAKNAILKMLSPKEEDRPFTKDIKNLDFFKSTNMIISNTMNYSKLIEEKNKIIFDLQTTVESQKNEILSLHKKISFYDQKNRDLSKSLERKYKSINGLQKTNPPTSTENETVSKKEFDRIKFELNKQEETVAYLFKKTKHLSTIISEFYVQNIMSKNLNITQDHILSYESTLSKIKIIFDEFLKMKEKEKIIVKDDKNEIKKKMDVTADEHFLKAKDLLSFDNNDDSFKTKIKPHVPQTTFDRNIKKI